MVLIGKTYWQSLITLLQQMVTAGTIAADDLQLLLVTDDLEEALAHIKRYAIDGFGLHARSLPKASRWLGESGVSVVITGR